MYRRVGQDRIGIMGAEKFNIRGIPVKLVK